MTPTVLFNVGPAINSECALLRTSGNRGGQHFVELHRRPMGRVVEQECYLKKGVR